MFYIIGVGLQPNQITWEAIEAIKNCDHIYIDNYTSIFSQGQLKDLQKIIHKKIIQLNRKELEQDLKYIKDKSCLLVIGSPLSATTHYTVYEEAKKRNLKTKIILGISVFNYKGICGLFEYKFGKTTSIVYPLKNYKPISFYNTIKENLSINAHTLCLLDIKIEENKLMNVKEACELLAKIDKEKDKLLTNKRCVVIAGMGNDNAQIISFNFKDYKNIECNTYPQSLIICSKLNDYESEALDEYR